MTSSWGPGTAFLLLAIGTVVYLNALPTPFQFDDQAVVHDPSLRDVSRLMQELPRSLRPLTKLSYALNYAAQGLDPAGYHLVNLGFHLLTALELFYLATNILPNSASFWAALLFTVHPMQTETVTYVSSRSNAMMAFFYLAGLITAIQGLSLWREGQKPRATGWFGIALLSYLAAQASRETAITLPLVLMAYDFYFLGGAANVTRHRVTLYAALGLLAISPFVLLPLHPRYHQLLENALGILANRPLTAHLLTQPVVIVTLLAKLALPIHLNVDPDYQLMTALNYEVVLSLCVLVAAPVLLFFYRKPILSFATLWFFITLLPQIVLPRPDFINERHFYLPSAGIVIGLTYLIFQLRWRMAALVVLGMMTLLLGRETIQRNGVYSDETTLWLDAVAKSPNKARPHNNLGHSYLKQGDWKQAASEFEATLSLNPAYTRASLNLGYVYLLQGNVEKARQVYLKALAHDPNSPDLQKALEQTAAGRRGHE